MKFYIGTSTNDINEGVYELTQKDGKFLTYLVMKTMNPTYMKVTEDFLFCTSKQKAGGAVALERDDNKLHFLSEAFSPGLAPCYIDSTRDGKYIVTADYHKGLLSLYTLENRQLIPLDLVKHSGHSLDPERQDVPHLHFASFAIDDKYILTCDLGTDAVTTYTIENNKLKKVSEIFAKPGSGVRHLVIHPSGNYLFIITELSNEIAVATLSSDGAVNIINAVTSYSDEHKNAKIAGAAIRISPCGNFVYISNREINTISVFAFDKANESLKLIQEISSFGDSPRDFDLDENGFLVVANQLSNNLTIFKRDEEAGTIELITKDISIPAPLAVNHF